MIEASLWIIGGLAAAYAAIILALAVLPRLFDPFDGEDEH